MTAEECLWHLSREASLLEACPPATAQERIELRGIIERLQAVLTEELEDVA
jgi:hypothetical protein